MRTRLSAALTCVFAACGAESNDTGQTDTGQTAVPVCEVVTGQLAEVDARPALPVRESCSELGDVAAATAWAPSSPDSFPPPSWYRTSATNEPGNDKTILRRRAVAGASGAGFDAGVESQFSPVLFLRDCFTRADAIRPDGMDKTLSPSIRIMPVKIRPMTVMG